MNIRQERDTHVDSSDNKSEKVRRMTPEDIDAIFDMDRKLSGGSNLFTPEDMAALEPGGPSDFSYIYERDDKMLGFVLARLIYVGVPFFKVVNIQAIITDPDCRHLGIASRLIEAIQEYSRSRGINIIRAVVHETDTQLQSFFEKRGFQPSAFVNYVMMSKD
jgi:ribosomal protein S18 acetylase RimI-like enzyme